MQRFVELAAGIPSVLRLGLATRGDTHLGCDDVFFALSRGVNYLNWCGRGDGISRAIRQLTRPQRARIVLGAQLEARRADDFLSEFEALLQELGTDYLDVATFYYVESEQEWLEISGPDGARSAALRLQRQGRIRLIGLTTHQRPVAAGRARVRDVDLVMIRYNAAHCRAEDDLFPLTDRMGIPVVAFTGVRWGALLRPTGQDPGGFVPPGAIDCYRFVLSSRSVAIALMAPDNRCELEADLALLDDWRGLTAHEDRALRAHGARVQRAAGAFP